MIKQIRYILGTLILLLVIILNVSFISNAYTEEEKQQAKAWLSAHGYSPDMSGANQAYQDYLNGKFDEELGYDTNGDGIPATTTDQTSQSSKEATTKAEDSTKDSAVKQKQGSSAATVPPDKETTTEDYKQKDTSTADSEMQTKEQSEMTETETEKGNTVKQKSAEQQEIENATLYSSKREKIYRNIVIVIVITILAMLLLVYLYIKYVQKKRDIH